MVVVHLKNLMALGWGKCSEQGGGNFPSMPRMCGNHVVKKITTSSQPADSGCN